MLVHGLLFENALPVLNHLGIRVRDRTERITRNGYRFRAILGPMEPWSNTRLLDDIMASRYLKRRAQRGVPYWRWVDALWVPSPRIANALCHHGWFDAIAALFEAGATRIDTKAGSWTNLPDFAKFCEDEWPETSEHWIDVHALLYGEPAQWPTNLDNRLFANCYCHVYEEVANHFGTSRAELKTKTTPRIVL